MDKFLREWDRGEIHIRDKWQFELKSEFYPDETASKNSYTQEFFIFIPNSLRINSDTYTKENFFRDQSNFIRYKTPVFHLNEINDLSNKLSPLARIFNLVSKEDLYNESHQIEYELKLLGNIVRSALRERILLMSKSLRRDASLKALPLVNLQFHELQKDLKIFNEFFMQIENILKNSSNHSNNLLNHYYYVDEFICNSIYYYFIEFLRVVRSIKNPELKALDSEICATLIQTFNQMKSLFSQAEDFVTADQKSEYLLYRAGLLNKFVLDALLLNTNRTSTDSKIKHFIGSFAAGIAMLFYFMLFLWQGQVLLINSTAFILTTVVLYILKDRLKEGLKSISYNFAFKWFPDYRTEIRSPNGQRFLGTLKENFFFLDPDDLSREISDARNKTFHSLIEDFRRPETLLYHKKNIVMKNQKGYLSRRYSLNLIFRFDIHHFLTKADDPIQRYLDFNQQTKEIESLDIPKVYHINIIMRNRYINSEGDRVTELDKFRLIVDKVGIKRVEHIL